MADPTTEQILEGLKNTKFNPKWTIGFMADNNFRGLQTNVNKEFDTLLLDRIPLRDFLVNKLKTPDWQKAVNALVMTKYIGNINPDLSVYDKDPLSKPYNYTTGYASYFNSLLPSDSAMTTKGVLWDSVFSGLGAGFSAYANANQTAQTKPATTAPPTPEELKKIEEAEAAAKKAAEEEAARKKRNTIILISVIGGLALLIVIFVIIRNSQQPKKIAA